MTERTAAEIRAYCEALPEGTWELSCGKLDWIIYGDHNHDTTLAEGCDPWEGVGVFLFNARTDLPRILEAAQNARWWLGWIREVVDRGVMTITTSENGLMDEFMERTKWLEEE